MLPLSYSIRHLARRRLRTALTVAGVALVTVLIVVLAAFARGLTDSLANSARADRVMLLSLGAESDPVRSAIARGQAELAAAQVPGVKQDASGRYASVEVMMMTTIKCSADDANDRRVAMVRGVSDAAYRVHDHVFVTAGREPHGDFEVMVGSLAAARLGLDWAALAIGERLFIEGNAWKIVGHFDAPGSPDAAELWCDLDDLMVASRRNDVTLVAAQLQSPDAIADAELFCLRRLDLEIMLQTEAAWFAAMLELMKPIAMMAQAMGLLVLIGGVLGCANTLYASALTRVKEFAALQTIGFRRRELAAGLLVEGLLLAGFAGLIGVAIAVAMGNVPLRLPMGAFMFRASPPDLLVGAGAALAIGVIGAAFPAWRVLRMPLVTALNS